MELVALLALGAVGAVALIGVVAVAVARDRRRRNQVVPGTDTGAPASWAGAHTPEARLHRRLRDAVRAARAVDDPDGALLSARVEVERAAVAVDRQLVALAAMPEREAATRMATASAAVAAVESAAASLADVGGAGRHAIATAGPGQLPEVERAVERTALLREAIAELDEVDHTIERPSVEGPPGTVRITPDASPRPPRDDVRDEDARGDEGGTAVGGTA